MADIMGLDIQRINHDAFRVAGNGKTIYFDPFKVDSEDEADVVFIGHEHFDHCSPEDIEKVSGKSTVLVVNENSKDKVSGLGVKEIITAEPGKKFETSGLKVEAVSAYNVNKFREPGKPFHPKKEKHCGYIVDFGNVKLYHAGDTDDIEEMYDVDCDVALLPVSGTYVMTAEEAVSALDKIRPKVVIPMHYGDIVGSKDDAEKFKDLVGKECEVRIL